MGFIYDTHKKFLFMDWLAGTIFHRIITKAMWSEKQTLCSSGIQKIVRDCHQEYLSLGLVELRRHFYLFF
jgi:hypothetical protein